MAEPATNQSYSQRLASAIGAVAAALSSSPPRIPPGDRASLRRGEGGPPFWKVAVTYLEPRGLLPSPGSPERSDAERRWRTVLASIAELAERHAPASYLGRTMAASRGSSGPVVSEARVMRLLRAHDGVLADTLRGVVHQLATSGRSINLVDIAKLVLSDGRSWEEQVRRDIAMDYYRRARSRVSDDDASDD